MDSDKKLCNSVYETSKPTNLESNLIKSDCLKRTLDGLVSHVSDSKDEIKSVQDEKVDVSPEISNKKSNDTSPSVELEKISDGSRMNKSLSLQTFSTSQQRSRSPFKNEQEEQEDDKSDDISKNMSFTIDFGSGKQVDEQRHKNLLERFQNRHRRGVSLSKMEDEDSSSSSQLTTKQKSPASAKLTRKTSATKEIETPQKPTSAGGVRLRDKSKATQLKDASKRHSWSPRSSMVDNATTVQPQKNSKATPSKFSNPLERPLKLHALTKSDLKPMPPTTLNISQCLQTPLENKQQSHENDDQVSEAGTYTLDGDNYTEEQKEKMNIDKLAMEHDTELFERKLEINESENDLEVIDLEQPEPERSVARHAVAGIRKNILEVSFYHQEPTTSVASNAKHKTSYLEKLKSRMKNISDKKSHKSKGSDGDMGMFTSVTTSGVLSIKPTLELNPRLKRKNSLTKSQIDSSEYVQGIQRPDSSKAGGMTDNDKSIAAGYQLNIFPKQSPSKSRKESVGSSNTSISTAATKDDWIQEWARNAREFSRQKRAPIAPVMSSSYNFEGSKDKNDQFGYFSSDDVMSRSECKPQYEEFGDNLEKYHQKSHHQKKPPTPEHHQHHHDDNSHHRQINNLSNHGSVSSARGRRILRDFDLNKDEPRVSTNFNIKPPISPSRIPSPIGSVNSRQRRFGSSAMLYGSETDLTNDTELYLQRTAAAISTLQNLQRRNSLRNTSLQNSPVSPMSPTRPPIVTQSTKPTVTTPHSRAQSATRNSVHKRNSSLDSSRYTPASIMSTSLQSNHLNHAMNGKKQQQHQQHSRHNSYDGMLPPHQPSTLKYSQFDQTDDDDYESMPSRGLPERQNLSNKQHQNTKQQQQQQSPNIKRSSSFNVKPQDVASPARASIVTPTMHKKFMKAFSAPTHGSRIQKSASSSCFKQMTRVVDDDDDDDYDNEFYINDDDDLNPNQLTSEGSDDDQKFTTTDPPISNTRYNKTFLMRCEQSKKAAASGVAGVKALGVVACPNTPEMPRRNHAERSSGRDRMSMPRDSSLSRLQEKKPLSAGATPTSKASAVVAGGKVTSKYLDISKYKADRGNNFLKRDESKSYLIREVKKSSSSACLQNFQRDLARTSSRSSGGAGSGSRPSSASNKKKEVKNAKEVELAMWKRRASYDPLKAAAEGKKKAEEAKRLAQQQQMMMSSESNSSALRSSKSYHCGGTAENWIDDESSSEFDDDN